MKLVFNARAFTYEADVPLRYQNAKGIITALADEKRVTYKRYCLRGVDEIGLFYGMGRPIDQYNVEPDDLGLGYVSFKAKQNMDFAERSSMKQADLTPIESVSDKVKSVTLHARDTMVVSHQLDRVDICSTSGHSFAPYQRLLDKFREANADVLEHSAMIITENTIYFANIPFEDAVVRMQNPKGQVIDLRANKSSLNYVL